MFLKKKHLCVCDKVEYVHTLQKHQNILKNATISRDSDIENVLGQWKKIYFKASSLFQ